MTNALLLAALVWLSAALACLWFALDQLGSAFLIFGLVCFCLGLASWLGEWTHRH
jgi:hypothetical protein